MKYELKIKDLNGMKAELISDLLNRDQERMKHRIREAGQRAVEEYFETIGTKVTLLPQLQSANAEVVMTIELPD